MAINTFQNNGFVSLITPDNYSATATGTGIDTQPYNGTSAFIMQRKAGTGTAPKLDVKLQHSSSLSSGYSDVTSGAFTQATAVSGIEAIEVDMNSVKRYVRAIGSLSGTTPAFDFGVSAVLPKQYGD